MAVHLAVAEDVFNGVFVLSFFPRDVLDEIWDLIESVSEGFPTYFFKIKWFKYQNILDIQTCTPKQRCDQMLAISKHHLSIIIIRIRQSRWS